MFRSVSCQFRLSRTRNCPAAVPRADPLPDTELTLNQLIRLLCIKGGSSPGHLSCAPQMLRSGGLSIGPLSQC